MTLRVLSGPSVLASLCFVLCLAKGAHARGPEWFEPADAAKPSAPDGKGEAPKATPEGAAAEGAAAEAPKAGEPKAEAPTPPAAPCPPPVRVAKPKRAEPPPPRVEWYGWQTIATDLAAVAFVGAGASDEEDGGVALLGLGTYLLGAPIVHAANGQFGKGVASLGLRVGVPVAGALGGLMLGSATCREDDGWNENVCPLGQAALGSLLGILAASTLDAAVLAKKEVRPRPAVSIAPAVLPTPRGTSFGLTGTF
ncbi:MAG TPA: hypothetical protein VFS43_07690 [Polyangiaceae bacterium]|nr:hypothetical protein [Polyangiaceae bacterium]